MTNYKDLATLRELVAQRTGRKWCLFIDRDGVINRQIIGGYVLTWRQFEWLPGVCAAVKMLRQWAPHLVVVTNQQGVGKGLMSPDDLLDIHKRIQDVLASHGTTISDFQVCPHVVSAGCRCRKPEPGLILEWLSRHPDCDPALSIMVGDSTSDLEAAQKVAAVTGGCAKIKIGEIDTSGLADASFTSLLHFAVAIGNAIGTESTP